MEEFKEGDVVHLKSGSPDMTVYGISEDRLLVSWFYENKFFTESFLKIVMTKKTYSL